MWALRAQNVDLADWRSSQSAARQFCFVWDPAGGKASDSAYRLALVDRGAITASVRATGTLNPLTTVLVGSQLSGQVVEIIADYNTPVKAGPGRGAAIFRANQIPPGCCAGGSRAGAAPIATPRARRSTRLRAALQRAEALAADLAAQRDRARAQLAEAQRNLDRQTELLARAVGTQNTLDQAKTQLDIQKAALVSAEAQIASNRAETAGLKPISRWPRPD